MSAESIAVTPKLGEPWAIRTDSGYRATGIQRRKYGTDDGVEWVIVAHDGRTGTHDVLPDEWSLVGPLAASGVKITPVSWSALPTPDISNPDHWGFAAQLVEDPANLGLSWRAAEMRSQAEGLRKEARTAYEQDYVGSEPFIERGEDHKRLADQHGIVTWSCRICGYNDSSAPDGSAVIRESVMSHAYACHGDVPTDTAVQLVPNYAAPSLPAVDSPEAFRFAADVVEGSGWRLRSTDVPVENILRREADRLEREQAEKAKHDKVIDDVATLLGHAMAEPGSTVLDFAHTLAAEYTITPKAGA